MGRIVEANRGARAGQKRSQRSAEQRRGYLSDWETNPGHRLLSARLYATPMRAPARESLPRHCMRRHRDQPRSRTTGQIADLAGSRRFRAHWTHPRPRIVSKLDFQDFREIGLEVFFIIKKNSTCPVTSHPFKDSFIRRGVSRTLVKPPCSSTISNRGG